MSFEVDLCIAAMNMDFKNSFENMDFKNSFVKN